MGRREKTGNQPTGRAAEEDTIQVVGGPNCFILGQELRSWSGARINQVLKNKTFRALEGELPFKAFPGFWARVEGEIRGNEFGHHAGCGTAPLLALREQAGAPLAAPRYSRTARVAALPASPLPLQGVLAAALRLHLPQARRPASHPIRPRPRNPVAASFPPTGREMPVRIGLEAPRDHPLHNPVLA